MQTLSGHFHIGGKAAKLLLAVIIGGLTVSSFVPKDWEVVRTVGQLLMMFSSGMLVSQHAAIWESEANKTTSSPSAGTVEGDKDITQGTSAP